MNKTIRRDEQSAAQATAEGHDAPAARSADTSGTTTERHNNRAADTGGKEGQEVVAGVAAMAVAEEAQWAREAAAAPPEGSKGNGKEGNGKAGAKEGGDLTLSFDDVFE